MQIGDTIHYVSYYVTKPTHQQRGTRMVRVRYEEERKYYAKSGKVTAIDNELVSVDNKQIPSRNVFDSRVSAEQAAVERQKKYQEHCDFSSMCR